MAEMSNIRENTDKNISGCYDLILDFSPELSRFVWYIIYVS